MDRTDSRAPWPATTRRGTPYHWIITVQIIKRGETGFATADGTYTVVTPTTRSEIYRWALMQITDALATNEVTVIFFSLELNTVLPQVTA